MKEATGETSMTVVTIVVIGLLLILAKSVFSSDGIVNQWIENTFNKVVNTPDPKK